jgi:hypothetical protein
MWNAEINSILSLYLTISMVVPNTADLNPYIFHMISWREEKEGKGNGGKGEEGKEKEGRGDVASLYILFTFSRNYLSSSLPLGI